MTFSVYILTCAYDERVYVGMSQAPSVRFTSHKFAAKSERGALYDAMRLHGTDSFDQEVIGGYATREEALDAEASLARTLRAEGRDLFNKTFLLDRIPAPRRAAVGCRARNRMNPIAVRPRKGSALAMIYEECGFNARVMNDLIHRWAEMATAQEHQKAKALEMAAASDKREEG